MSFFPVCENKKENFCDSVKHFTALIGNDSLLDSISTKKQSESFLPPRQP